MEIFFNKLLCDFKKDAISGVCLFPIFWTYR
jgi:hypothetical protein